MNCTSPTWRWCAGHPSGSATDAMPELAYGSAPVPATPIGDLRRWQLDIRCSHCRRHVPLPIADLIGPYDHRMKIAEVIRRLRCSGPRDCKRCRAIPSRGGDRGIEPAEGSGGRVRWALMGCRTTWTYLCRNAILRAMRNRMKSNREDL